MGREPVPPHSTILRAIAPALVLLIAFALARPAIGQETLPTATPQEPSRLPQTWAPGPAQATPACATLTCAPPPEPSPVYTRWSFWLSIGLVAVAGVVTGVLLERRNHDDLDMPTTTFGTKEF